MAQTRLILIGAALLACVSCSSSFKWEKIVLDGHRTGVESPSASDVALKLGTVSQGVYRTPSGAEHTGDLTARTGELLIGAQEVMSELKTELAYAPRDMRLYKPQSPLSNWAVDVVMEIAADVFSQSPDLCILNFGGIRTEFGAGPVLKDDVVSMFPFKNRFVLVNVPGWRVRQIFEMMFGGNIQAFGGARVRCNLKGIESIEIGGEPLDDNRVYKLATIDFLLDKGDGMYLGKDAVSIIKSDLYLIDRILPYVGNYGKSGIPLEYGTDDRIVYIGD